MKKKKNFIIMIYDEYKVRKLKNYPNWILKNRNFQSFSNNLKNKNSFSL